MFNWTKAYERFDYGIIIKGDETRKGYCDEAVPFGRALEGYEIITEFCLETFKRNQGGQEEDQKELRAVQGLNNVKVQVFESENSLKELITVEFDSEGQDYQAIILLDAESEQYLVVETISGHPRLLHKKFEYGNSDGCANPLRISHEPVLLLQELNQVYKEYCSNMHQ